VNTAAHTPYHPPLALAVAVAAGTLLGLAKNMAEQGLPESAEKAKKAADDLLGAWKADNAKAVAS
jgi:hypothetical protein